MKEIRDAGQEGTKELREDQLTDLDVCLDYLNAMADHSPKAFWAAIQRVAKANQTRPVIEPARHVSLSAPVPERTNAQVESKIYTDLLSKHDELRQAMLDTADENDSLRKRLQACESKALAAPVPEPEPATNSECGYCSPFGHEPTCPLIEPPARKDELGTATGRCCEGGFFGQAHNCRKGQTETPDLRKFWLEWQESEGFTHHTIDDWPLRFAKAWAARSVAPQASPEPKDVTLNDAAKVLRKITECASFSSQLILLREFGETYARARTASPEASKEMAILRPCKCGHGWESHEPGRCNESLCHCEEFRPVASPEAPVKEDEQVGTLTLETVLKELDYCGIHFDAELAAEGAGWESAAEPEPQYFETLREAIGFQISLTDPIVPPVAGKDWLESQEFYELMQAYRISPLTKQRQVYASYEAVKSAIRARLGLSGRAE